MDLLRQSSTLRELLEQVREIMVCLTVDAIVAEFAGIEIMEGRAFQIGDHLNLCVAGVVEREHRLVLTDTALASNSPGCPDLIFRPAVRRQVIDQLEFLLFDLMLRHCIAAVCYLI